MFIISQTLLIQYVWSLKISLNFIGVYTGLVPLYNAEVAPPSIRGSVGTINQLAATFGLLTSQALGLGEALGTEQLWPWLLGMTL